MKYYILIISLIYSIHLQAQTYAGKIGDHPIFLELDIDYDNNRATALYFFKSHLQNIPLEGNHDSTELVLFEKYSEREDTKELFTLSIDQDKISGTWQNDERILNVNLTKSTKNIDDYKLSLIEFVRDSITTYGEKELVWLTEKYSKKSLFRLGNGFTKLEREFMNSKLDSMQTQYAMIGLECGWADIEIEIDLVSDQYISFTEYSSIDCGGAHPSHNTIGYNFDLKSKVQLDDLTDIYPNLNHYQLLKKKYKDDADLQSECEYFIDEAERFEYYSWTLNENGVIITPSYPHAMTPCVIGFLLTYKEIQQE